MFFSARFPSPTAPNTIYRYTLKPEADNAKKTKISTNPKKRLNKQDPP
jgi:hypothetical protein